MIQTVNGDLYLDVLMELHSVQCMYMLLRI